MARKITEDAVRAFLNGYKFKRANTEVFQYGDTWHYRLHNSKIAYREKGELYISTCGWNTPTTRERLNGLPGVSCYNDKHELYLNGCPWDGEWKRVGD